MLWHVLNKSWKDIFRHIKKLSAVEIKEKDVRKTPNKEIMLISFMIHELYVPNVSQINIGDLHPFELFKVMEWVGLQAQVAPCSHHSNCHLWDVFPWNCLKEPVLHWNYSRTINLIWFWQPECSSNKFECFL